MSEPTEAEALRDYEQAPDDASMERYLRAGGIASRQDVRDLLRLLDAERARADAAEAKVADLTEDVDRAFWEGYAAAAETYGD